MAMSSPIFLSVSSPRTHSGGHLPGGRVEQRGGAGGAAAAAAPEAVVAHVPPHVPPLPRGPPRRSPQHPAPAHLGHHLQVN